MLNILSELLRLRSRGGYHGVHFVVVSGSSSERTRAYEVMWGACDDVVCGTGRKSRLLRRSRQEQRTKVGCTGEDKWLEVEAMKETQKATQ